MVRKIEYFSSKGIQFLIKMELLVIDKTISELTIHFPNKIVFGIMGQHLRSQGWELASPNAMILAIESTARSKCLD
jgi:hypothetical protein